MDENSLAGEVYSSFHLVASEIQKLIREPAAATEIVLLNKEILDT